MSPKREQCAKAFFYWLLPFGIANGANPFKRMKKDAFGCECIVEIRHHNSRVGADFREEYFFYEDGTLACTAEAFPSSPDSDFGEGFSVNKYNIRISDLPSISRILANVPGGGETMGWLPTLEKEFEKIVKGESK